MIANVKKVPPLSKVNRRQARPYPKGDITIEDQQREQRKLLNAGKAFSGYSQLNLDIIAISYETKCFNEAKNREDYIAKIRKKLIEWKYVPVDEEEANGVPQLQPPPQPPVQQKAHSQLPQSPKAPRSNHQRHRSGPILQGNRENIRNGSARGSPGGPINAPISPVKELFPHTGQFPATPQSAGYQSPYPPDQQRQQLHTFGPHSLNGNGHNGTSSYHSPPHESQQQPRAQTSSPKSQPMTHTSTTISDTSSNTSHDQFVDIFDPKFLSTLDLNNPETRAMWIKSVWEYFCSGAQWNGYGQNGSKSDSPNNSPVPIYSTITSRYLEGPVDMDVNMHGVQHNNGNNDVMGAFINFNNRSNCNGRRQSEDIGRTRIHGSGNNHEAFNGHNQWLASDFHNLDLTMGNMSNMDGVMSGDSINSTAMSPRSFEKWVVQ